MLNSCLSKSISIRDLRFGFTLAEVLLTLGIIGVLAAMTIPTLISNTNSAKFRSQFKKSISTLSQAGLMAQAHHEFDYAANGNSTVSCSTDADPNNSDYTFCAIFNSSLSGASLSTEPPRANYELPENLPFYISEPMYLTLADGMLVIFDGTASNCTKSIASDINEIPMRCGAYIDVNGTSMPNKLVSCDDPSLETSGVAASRGVGGDSHSELAPFYSGSCRVSNDANHLTDIFPVVFHDSTVEPASLAANYILKTAK